MVSDATEANKAVGRKPEDNVALSSNRDDSTKAEVDMWAVVPTESVDAVPLGTCVGKKRSISVSGKTKRGLDSKKDDCFDESYMEKVEQLSRIKQKQEEDKKSLRLHSFRSGSKKRGSGAALKNDDVMRSLRFSSVSKKVRASKTSINVPLDFPSTVLTFEVYHSRKPGFKVQEFLILGGQFLTEAKDRIACVSDEMMKKAGVYDPSGYFLIEVLFLFQKFSFELTAEAVPRLIPSLEISWWQDCFYNDMRSPCASDYSEPIFTWLEKSRDEALEKWEYVVSGGLHQKQKAVLGSNKKMKLPDFRSFPMETTRFCDLRFRLGAGYLYCHQVKCIQHSDC
ncbi:hypothetical protein M569_16385 [Genlisea aurea]|uniref:snRNA-activating protein complex subunit n=1 Tax=Genlisea aurea TaxID=192259 RepID=S8BVQ1_9LAMI|nr:hypothetical protein M569_16385 [Genlisea aurea]